VKKYPTPRSDNSHLLRKKSFLREKSRLNEVPFCGTRLHPFQEATFFQVANFIYSLRTVVSKGKRVKDESSPDPSKKKGKEDKLGRKKGGEADEGRGRKTAGCL